MTRSPAIAIASGKGGTGKTTVAVHLAAALVSQKRTVQYLDCDVEEPNGHLFLKPSIVSSETIGIPVPAVDAATDETASPAILSVPTSASLILAATIEASWMNVFFIETFVTPSTVPMTNG